MKRTNIFFLLLAAVLPLHAQKDSTTVHVDSIPLRDTAAVKEPLIDKITDSRLFQTTYVGVPLIVGGLIEKHQDKKFRTLRNDFLPEFKRPFDNYLQFLPAAVMVGLKAAGVKSRSSWGRMLATDAIATAMMATAVQTTKHLTTVYRPDGSDSHSFPSGHTATAFMVATMLSKEYGYLSPWVSVGAYGVAATTGLMRIANNKHWLSDVMVGAGVGILSTEMAYWITDAIYKNKGRNTLPTDGRREQFGIGNPSFLSLYAGFNLPLSHYDLNEKTVFQTATGTTMGLEGAWFFTPYIGIGGQGSISNLRYIINDTEAADNTIDFYQLMAGPYFSLPLSRRWSVGSKLVGGRIMYPSKTIGDVHLGHRRGWTCGTGVSIDYQVHQHLQASLFLNYNLQAPQSKDSGEYMHIMTLGAKIGVRF
ncbi:phosphatase PAP2 family protein [Prevotella sp. AGR2160]|uniref:phosphatase PAP2 family protein n=1 Tax=Prevotella sp. AGR2160 TaxID=1280674 RepID=UPI00040F6F21|nr:phosphatase PAP2 family protein [Prevotella sp. AGR2160]